MNNLHYEVVANERHTVRIATWQDNAMRWFYAIWIDGAEVDRGDLRTPRP